MKLTPIRILAVLVSLALSVTMSAQTHTVTGKVTDSSNGEAVIGAGVVLSTGGGTVTDYDGNFVISAPENAVITFSSLGYQSVTQAVGNRTVINVELAPDNELLGEVVVLGYTTQKKAELTSAVVSMSGEELRTVATNDVGNMLQGKVAGVVVMNGSGRPGESADIRVRGTGSITAGAGPLYVVDGVAGGSFNPNDIETITVLKDASATALYGAAASGGVIVVTTKSGQQDKTSVEFKASGGIKRALTGRFHPMNSAQLYDFTKSMTDPAAFASTYPESLLGQDFDWLANCFKTGIVQDYYTSVAGKSGKVSYFISADHYNEQGTLLGTSFRKTSGRMNLSAPITDRLTLTLRLNYAKSHDRTEAGWRMMEYSYYAMPWDIPYVIDADGNYTDEYVFVPGTSIRSDNGEKWWTQNPSNILHSAQYNYGAGWGDSLTGDLQLVWNITDWLTFTSMNRYDTSNSFWEDYTDARTYDGADSAGSLGNSEGEWNGWGTTDLLKFHHSFGDHDVNGIIGGEFGEGYSRSLGVEGDHIPQGQRAISNTANWIGSGSDYHTRAWAVLGQAQYSYLGKYILTASVRYDESSKFGPKNRGGWFPGASAAWIISREKFLDGNNNLTFLKLRAGYGKTGNDNIPNFAYQETYNMSGQYNGAKAGTLERMSNPYLGWEEAYMASLGLDATIRNNWNVTVDLYHTINSKILLESPMPGSSGFYAVMDNVGKVRNMGAELAFDGAIINNRDFGWDLGFNMGFNQNRVLELPEHKDIVMTRGEVNQIISENKDIYSWYMPKWAGVDSETGLPQWEKVTTDADGNVTDVTIVNNWSEATNQIVGSASPWFSGGLNTAFRWKGFTLSANGNFVVGNKVYNKLRESMDHDGSFIGMNLMSIDNGLGWSRWQEPGDVATHPMPASGRKDGAALTSSRFLEDGSFFRLRNVTLSYNLPQTFLQKIRTSDARIYVSADNVFTLSRFSGMDPEVRLDADTYHHAGMYSQNYPIPMTLTMGIDVKF